MSIITLQYGQCGNQIGQKLYSTLYEDISLPCANISDKQNKNYTTEAMNRWFHVTDDHKLEARSVLVDTEPKAIATNGHSLYNFSSVICKSVGGCANNWACGYSLCEQQLSEEILNQIRRQVEKCDLVNTIFSMSSVAGGTGSGVGSKITECVRDQYPNKLIMNAVVLPYRMGEVVNQSYNTLLTLNHLYSISDMLIVFENDHMHNTCGYAHSNKIDFMDLNIIIARQLASVLQPIPGLQLSKFITDLTSHPSYKFVQLRNAPNIKEEYTNYESSKSWSELVRSLQNRFWAPGEGEKVMHNPKIIRKLGSFLISRGKNAPNEDSFKLLLDKKSAVSWLPNDFGLQHYHNKRPFCNLEKCVALASNSNRILVWTKSDKEKLLFALQKHGADNISLLAEELPFKAVGEIRQMIQSYQRLAANTLRAKCGDYKVSDAPLEKWLKHIQDVLGRKVPTQVVPKALKYIALYEKRENSDINLTECYKVLQLCTSGVPAPELDKKTAAFMRKCIKNLAIKIKHSNTDKQKHFLSNINIENPPGVKTYSKKDSYISNLVSDPAVNTLGVPRNLLQ